MHPSYHPKVLAKSGADHQGVNPSTPRYIGAPLPNSADQTRTDNVVGRNVDEPTEPQQTQQPAMYYSSAP